MRRVGVVQGRAVNVDQLESLKRNVSRGADVSRLRDQLAALVSSGEAKEEIVARLHELRADFRGAGDERSEDVVLELLDFAVGWCAPHMRL